MIPSVGSRVSIRHRLPTGEFTDVIGHLLALTPNVVVRSKSGELVEISRDDVVAMRELSHRPVRASEIRALEHAAALAWPGTEQHWHGGWFLRAGSFETVAAMIDGGHLSVSHGEGFLGLIADRMQEQGIYILDEPEAALSPRRQAELLAFLAEIQQSASAQVIMATHSPMLMAVPGAALWRLTHRGLSRVDYRDTDHFRLWQTFTVDPDDFVSRALAGDIDSLV